MKNLHIVSIAFLSGLIMGAALPAHAEMFICDIAVNGNHSVSNIDFKPLNGGKMVLIQRSGFEPFLAKQSEANPFVYHTMDDEGQTVIYNNGVWTIQNDALSASTYFETCYHQ